MDKGESIRIGSFIHGIFESGGIKYKRRGQVIGFTVACGFKDSTRIQWQDNNEIDLVRNDNEKFWKDAELESY